jgi:hypothetical protein
MSDDIKSWFAEYSGFEGLLGMGVAAAGGDPEFRAWVGEVSVAELGNVWHQASDVLEVLRAGRLPSDRMRWKFDDTVVYLERRKDGAKLMLFTAQEPWVGGDGISGLLATFRGMQ